WYRVCLPDASGKLCPLEWCAVGWEHWKTLLRRAAEPRAEKQNTKAGKGAPRHEQTARGRKSWRRWGCRRNWRRSGRRRARCCHWRWYRSSRRRSFWIFYGSQSAARQGHDAGGQARSPFASALALSFFSFFSHHTGGLSKKYVG